MQTDLSQHVSSADLESLLAALEDLPGVADGGFFGPHSISWMVNRESAVFLGAGRAALLQLAHPWVAAALAQHSNLLHAPIERFHSTFRVIYTMLFGTRAQALAASRQLHRRHAGIRGELPHSSGACPQGQQYQANEVAALRWVYATLVDSALLAYEVVRPPLSIFQREQYYEESKRMGALFGIPPAALPPAWADFRLYMADMFASATLGVDANARALGESVLAGVGTAVKPPPWYHAMTGAWLPARLAAGFGLASGPRQDKALGRALRWLPRVYPVLPSSVRFVGPYHEATARLRGAPPGPLTLWSNRFWMGQPRLLYADDRTVR